MDNVTETVKVELAEGVFTEVPPETPAEKLARLQRETADAEAQIRLQKYRAEQAERDAKREAERLDAIARYARERQAKWAINDLIATEILAQGHVVVRDTQTLEQKGEGKIYRIDGFCTDYKFEWYDSRVVVDGDSKRSFKMKDGRWPIKAIVRKMLEEVANMKQHQEAQAKRKAVEDLEVQQLKSLLAPYDVLTEAEWRNMGHYGGSDRVDQPLRLRKDSKGFNILLSSGDKYLGTDGVDTPAVGRFDFLPKMWFEFKAGPYTYEETKAALEVLASMGVIKKSEDAIAEEIARLEALKEAMAALVPADEE